MAIFSKKNLQLKFQKYSNFLLENIHVELNIENNNKNISNILMSNPHIQTNKKQMLESIKIIKEYEEQFIATD